MTQLANLRVYEVLREKIENLSFLPGQELDQKELSETLEVSRSPVRDALLRLERDKLVDIFPQRGTRVSFLDEEDIYQERFMRLNLELGALRKCIEKERTDGEHDIFITKLKCFLMQQEAAFKSGDMVDFFRYDDEMHHMFYSECGFERIWSVLQAHSGNEHRIRILSYKSFGIAENVEKQHRELVDAIERKDVKAAVEIEKAHLSQHGADIEEQQREIQSYFSKQEYLK